MPSILSTHPLHPRATAMLAGAGKLVVASALDAKTLVAEAADADIVIVRAPLPPELFQGAARLRAAIRHGAGLDMIPVEAATSAGVLVANVPAVNARSVAEHVMFVTLALLRRFRMVDRDLRAKGWLAGRCHANDNTELAGKTIGIVRVGDVGLHRTAADLLGKRLGLFASGAIADDDGRAGACELGGDRTADAARGPGDERKSTV